MEFCVPPGSAEEPIVKVEGATTSDSVTDFVCAGFSASATVAVRLVATIGEQHCKHLCRCSTSKRDRPDRKYVVASVWDDWDRLFDVAAGERRHGALHLVLRFR